MLKFKHSCNTGDLIAAMAGIKKLCDDRNKKAIIYQRLDLPGGYYEGAVHPTVNDKGEMVCMNQKMFDMIKPLVEHQYYIQELRVWKGEAVDFDLDNIRIHSVGMPNFPIQRWYYYVYPQMATDLSNAWIDVSGINFYKSIGIEGKIIINRTERYNNTNLSFYFLKQYERRLMFLGTEHEHKLFMSKWELDFQRLHVNNFLEAASALNNCKFMVGNQSFLYNLAEAMKSPRVLELCQYAPNCIVTGKDGYDFLHQSSLEYYFKNLA
jgi:hypothetical protein